MTENVSLTSAGFLCVRMHMYAYISLFLSASGYFTRLSAASMLLDELGRDDPVCTFPTAVKTTGDTVSCLYYINQYSRVFPFPTGRFRAHSHTVGAETYKV